MTCGGSSVTVIAKTSLPTGRNVVDLIRYFVDDSPVKWVMGQIDRSSDKADFGHRVEHNAIGHSQFAHLPIQNESTLVSISSHH